MAASSPYIVVSQRSALTVLLEQYCLLSLTLSALESCREARLLKQIRENIHVTCFCDAQHLVLPLIALNTVNFWHLRALFTNCAFLRKFEPHLSATTAAAYSQVSTIQLEV